MNLSNDTYDQLLKDWWENATPLRIKEIRYLGKGEKGEINYVVHIYADKVTNEIIVSRDFVSRKAFLAFLNEVV